MRYLVTACLKPSRGAELKEALDQGKLGYGSVAGGEYIRNMYEARLRPDGSVQWVEVCFCHLPLDEERPYWEEYFDLLKVQNAQARTRCRDLNGSEPWACSDCDCTLKLEAHLARVGKPFLEDLEQRLK